MELYVVVIIAIAAACVGFLLGFVVRALTRRKKGSDDEGAKESGGQPKKPANANKAPRRNWEEVANLWRDQRDGRLIFQIEDKMYKRGDELSTREREILLKIVMDFYRWLEPPSAISSKSKTQGKLAPTNGIAPDPALAPNGLPETAPEVSLAEQAEQKKERLTPVTFVTNILSSEVTIPTPASPSMVAQVDSILQDKLETAKMQKWAVRLIESPERGMIVLVGLEQYSAIDEVPYERVRSIIRASVAEWEQRAENGDNSQ